MNNVRLPVKTGSRKLIPYTAHKNPLYLAMPPPDTSALLRSIPAMDCLLTTPWAEDFSATLGRENVKKIIVEALEQVRQEIRGGAVSWDTHPAPVEEFVARRAQNLLGQKASSTLKPVVNATGVVLHTNLGRAPLAKEALAAVNAVAGTYSTLEYSPETGGRGGRNTHIEWLICQATGAAAALAVNNNAAAVLLALSSLAAGREVIVSSGELVEIGDSFRIPDILAFSGAQMRAVGCTNAVRLADYSGAINENTAALLKVHPSNYRIAGFVTVTRREALAALARERGLVLIEDLGSGLLCPLAASLTEQEQTVGESLAGGSHLVTFSGDKLLGGPQIGVIAGSKPLIDKIKRHQLLRALRVDKMTLAAFEATLRLYLAGRQHEIPAIKMIEQAPDTLRQTARRLCRLLQQAAKAGPHTVTISVIETADATGGGAFPTGRLPGVGVAIHSPTLPAETLAAALRTAARPVIPGIQDGQVILHVRTLLDGDEKIIAASFLEALRKNNG